MIGISKTDTNFHLYCVWLDHFGVRYKALDYKMSEEGFKDFEDCNGLILTGGVDIYPEIYCDWDTAETKGTYNPERDGFELKILEMAVSSEKPVLGICRGMQVMNVYFLGSLIFDIKDQRGTDHSKIIQSEPIFHEIRIFEGSLLHDITGVTSGIVNSYHHQAVDRMGNGLTPNARSVDGIVEGMEYEDKTGKPFLLGIQWHPERSDPEDTFSANIIKRFINECKVSV